MDKPKYNVDDLVWMVDFDKKISKVWFAKGFKIDRIMVQQFKSVEKNEIVLFTIIEYTDWCAHKTIEEDDLFSTAEEAWEEVNKRNHN